MTEPFDEYGDRLRRALNTEAEAVAPSPEGLEQIRAKINKRRERRFGLWYAAPWLRPLVAVGAAVFISMVAVSASPALKNFVQTGHFSPADNGDNGGALTGDHSLNRSVPGNSWHPNSNVSAPPSSPRPTASGKHTTRGSCAPGETQVGPPGAEAADASPAPQATVTCQPDQPTAVPATPPDGPTSAPPTPPTENPPSDQPTDPQPSVQQSP